MPGHSQQLEERYDELLLLNANLGLLTNFYFRDGKESSARSSDKKGGETAWFERFTVSQ